MIKRNTKILSSIILIGKIGNAYGINGWTKIHSFSEKKNRICNYQPWFIKKENQWKTIKISNWKCCNKKIIVKISGIKSREEVYLLRNNHIFINIKQLPKLYSNEYYWREIIGCKIITINGFFLGNVINLIETGSNDILIVQNYKKDIFGIQERLIPFIEKLIIHNVDVAKKIILVNWNPKD